MRSYARKTLSIPKSNRSRVAPMVPRVAQALARLGQRGYDTMADDLVFHGETGGFLDDSAMRRRYHVACDVTCGSPAEPSESHLTLRPAEVERCWPPPFRSQLVIPGRYACSSLPAAGSSASSSCSRSRGLATVV